MPDKKMWILYFGRLDDEKWFGLILDMLKNFIQEYWEIPFSFYVFGKGKYVQDLLDIAAKHNSIHFFGRQPLETIQRYKENCQYCLVPSTFLETFWLTALNWLSMWLPVIWFAKWWLKQFVPKKYDISQSNWNNDWERLYNKINELFTNYDSDKTDIEKEKKRAKNMAKKYSLEKRFENAQELLWKPKRILMVTDFKSKLGGIETYVHDVKDILKEKWYEVKIYWAKIPKWKLWQMLKYFGLFFAMWNFVDAIRLKRVAKKFKPKVVRYHSAIRRMWWLPIKVLSSHNSKKFMMYHDLWYFHPFPSSVTQEEMINMPTKLYNFIKSWNTKNPIKIIAIFFKYISVCLLKKQLKKYMDKHLVPSDFLEKIVSDWYEIEPKKVQTLSHFIQK